MDFSLALAEIKAGSRVQREGWNGPDQCVSLHHPQGNGDIDDDYHDNHLPYLIIVLVSGNIIPWLASQGDLLANDWRVVP